MKKKNENLKKKIKILEKRQVKDNISLRIKSKKNVQMQNEMFDVYFLMEKKNRRKMKSFAEEVAM